MMICSINAFFLSIYMEEEHCPVVDTGCSDCPLCQLNATDPIIQKMNEMEESLSGKVSSTEIFKLIHDFYLLQKKELERQKMPCPEITLEQIEIHYTKHRVNLKTIVANEIFLANEMQSHFEASQIATRDASGQKTLHSKSVDQWIRLSKHKLDLVKYYQSLSKHKVSEPTGIKPFEFN